MCLRGTVDEGKFILNNYNETFSRFGLKIAKDKTETVAFNCSKTIQEQNSLFSIEGVAIKNVRTFKYLGYKISNELSNNYIDAQFRITLAENKSREMKKLLCDRDIPIKLRAKTFLQAFVRSRMCYSAQAWTIKEQEMKVFESKWHGFLRRMINGGFARKKDGMSYRYTNEDLIRITGTNSIRNFIQK